MDYGPEVRRRFLAPARAGTIQSSAGCVFDGAAEDRSLGFWVRFQVKVAKAEIGEVRFQAFSCPHGIAAADLVAAELEGKPIDSLTTVDPDRIARKLGIPREKFGKLLRIEDALAACHAKAVSKDRE